VTPPIVQPVVHADRASAVCPLVIVETFALTVRMPLAASVALAYTL
jgi:hypothetical protein